MAIGERTCEVCGTTYEKGYNHFRPCSFRWGTDGRTYECNDCYEKRKKKIVKKRGSEIRYIYVLTDPRIQKIFYVGQTKHPHNRVNGHVADGRFYISCAKKNPNFTPHRNLSIYVSRMLKDGVKPELYVIETTTFKKVSEREMWWVNRFREIGIKLQNTSTQVRLYE